MPTVLFRGGKFDGRSRDFGPDVMPVIELHVGKGVMAHYVDTGTTQDGALVYELSTDERTVLPYTVHFGGGPFAGKGRHFPGQPAEVLVIPISPDPAHPDHGFFARYKRDPRASSPGQPLLYTFVEKFEGER